MNKQLNLNTKPKINRFVNFLRHYGPIDSSDNMYDEHIQVAIDEYGISDPLEIRLPIIYEIIENFKCDTPSNFILTGTAGDGKTHLCRNAWEKIAGDGENWTGGKFQYLELNESKLTVIKDFSELTESEKNNCWASLHASIVGENSDKFLIAANDGQLLSGWKKWSDNQSEHAKQIYRKVEDALVEREKGVIHENLKIFNLSHENPPDILNSIVVEISSHALWSQCDGCTFSNNNSMQCPIRLNLHRLSQPIFIERLQQLLALSLANSWTAPIRDQIMLVVNIILGVADNSRQLMNCEVAHEIANSKNYRATNPYENVFGMNIDIQKRAQYQIFNMLHAFGIGRETDNEFDWIMIYEAYQKSEVYKAIPNDEYYGRTTYENHLNEYIGGERQSLDEFLTSLASERRRLFFSLDSATNPKLQPWKLTVYSYGSEFLTFVNSLKSKSNSGKTIRKLLRGINRSFCGLLIEEDATVYLATSGGAERGRIAVELKCELKTFTTPMDKYLGFSLHASELKPVVQIFVPTIEMHIAEMTLMLEHFEFLMRVSEGALPINFSRQCYEDILDFKLKAISEIEKITTKPELEIIALNEKGSVVKETILLGDLYS